MIMRGSGTEHVPCKYYSYWWEIFSDGVLLHVREGGVVFNAVSLASEAAEAQQRQAFVLPYFNYGTVPLVSAI